MTTTDKKQEQGAADFVEWFQDTFGAPFPLELGAKLQSVNDRVWVSENLVGSVQAPPMVPEFSDAADNYAIAGLWGHGVNSSAFYFVEKRGGHQRFFRLMCGGGYGHYKTEKRDLLAYLDGYRAWREKNEDRLQSSTLIHNMGINKAQLSREGHQVEFSKAEEGAAWWQSLEEQSA